MPSRKTLKRSALGLLGLLLIVGVVLYVQANLVPSAYRPADLAPEQREAQADHFIDQIATLYNHSQRFEPYEWVITQDQLNAYLASMDEIASAFPGGATPGQIDRTMQEAGLSKPAVSMRDGVLTLMVRSTSHDKILSVGLRFSHPQPDRLEVRLASTRVGRLGLPHSAAQQALAQLKDGVRKWAARDRRGRASPGRSAGGLGLSPSDIGAALASVIGAIDERPVSTVCEIDGKRVRIAALNIRNAHVTLRIEPVDGSASPAAPQHDDWPEELRTPRDK